MKVSDLLGAALITADDKAVADQIIVSGINDDSRKIKQGDAFFAIMGNAVNGALYSHDAEKRGAVVIIAPKGAILPAHKVPVLYVENIRHVMAKAAAKFYQKQPPVVVAVTGTSGKTSVTAFLRQIWESSGFSSASIGTIGVVSKDYAHEGSLTTPGALELAQLMQGLAKKHITHVAMEASSHGIEQCRLDGVKLSAAGFTNLGRDHMDYHPTVEAYFAAKMRLFDSLLPENAPAVVFADDKYSDKAIAHIEAAGRKVLTVGRKGNYIKLKRVEHERFRQYVELEFDGKIYELVLPLAGEFQVANALVAAGLAIAGDMSAASVFRSLELLKGAPGRLQLVGSTKDGTPAYVDYAHKPDALENMLKSVRPFTNGNIVLVFGCGGDRDKGKRPIMGEIAAKLADKIIVTDDNPRTENAETIRKQILCGAPKALEIGDRREAIKYAVGLLKCGDSLIVAGKGHETGQIVGDKVLPFSDYSEVSEALIATKEK